MNKKLAAVVVAGLFAAPVSALAQSSVTISGVIKMSLENVKYSNFGGGAVGGRAGNSGVYGLADDSSRIIFNVVEDLGGGLQAIGQLDIRVKPDDAQGAQLTGGLVTGNSHVGLRSSSWGRIFVGRQDLHYFNTESNMTSKANSLRSDPISLIAYAGAYGAVGAPPANSGGVAIASASRTQNVVHYTTPNWSGFTAIVAYSSSPAGADSDMGLNGGAVGTRKGYAWNVNPNYAASNWQIGYSYWKSKPDLVGAGVVAPAATNDQRADRVYGSYTFGFGLKIGLAWDKSRLNTNAPGGANIKSSDRQVWSIPLRYEFGNHGINFHYTWAQSDKGASNSAIAATPGLDTKASMWAIGYNYDISKRTAVGLTYAQINNKQNAMYNFFTGASLGIQSTAAVAAGEDPKLFAATIRHAF